MFCCPGLCFRSLIDKRIELPYHQDVEKLTFGQALERIEAGKIESAYLLIGEDYHQKFLITEKVTRRKLGDQRGSLNRHSLIGKKANPQTLEQLLAGVPLFGGNTVVIVSDVDKLPEKSQESLPRLLKNKDAATTFIGTATKLDGRKAFSKALASSCTLVETKEIYDNHLPGYIQTRLAARGLSIDAAAVNEFARLVGNDCGDIENEVEKIAIVHHGKKRLTLPDVQAFLSASHFFDQYAIAESVSQRKPREALTATQQFLESSGADGRGRLFWALYTQFERMLTLQTTDGRIKDADLAGKLRMHPFLLQRLREQAARFKAEELVAVLHRVYEAEVADRFSAEAKQQIFERMILQIAAPTKE